VPVIDERGVHRLTVLAKAHQADCGNSLPTTYMGHARDVYEEGALIFHAVRIQKDYRDIDDIIRMCRLRIRVPEQWWGDYLAALSAVRIGEQALLELLVIEHRAFVPVPIDHEGVDAGRRGQIDLARRPRRVGLVERPP
jgi:N-methylhydantoinase B/oxoprolinase/acetone carboxylase alpha subunit